MELSKAAVDAVKTWKFKPATGSDAIRSKAELTQDPAEHQALIAEADRLWKQAAELEGLGAPKNQSPGRIARSAASV